MLTFQTPCASMAGTDTGDAESGGPESDHSAMNLLESSPESSPVPLVPASSSPICDEVTLPVRDPLLSTQQPEQQNVATLQGPPPKKSRIDQFFRPRKSAVSKQQHAGSHIIESKNPTTPHSSTLITKRSSTKAASCTNPCTDLASSIVPKLDAQGIPLPIVPQQVSTPAYVQWIVQKNGAVLVRRDRRSASKPCRKAAAIDMDGTVLLWQTSFWPTRLEQYELYNADGVVPKLQSLADDGYQLVLVSNQGGIRSATNGKTAQKVKSLMDWLATILQRPLWAIVSTQSKSGFHKPSPKLWDALEEAYGEKFDIKQSLYVGDSDGEVDDSDAYRQEGVDKAFAANVSASKNAMLRFYNPSDFFGPSDKERRMATVRSGLTAYAPTPISALRARAALLGGYLTGPLLVLLCGAQGSGKSTFCQALVQITPSTPPTWRHFSQDTIANGKPGSRTAVEDAARLALSKGVSVVIDRMHLDTTQRTPFVQIGKDACIPVHVIVLDLPRSVVLQRVRDRTNHVGKVQGEQGVQLATVSLDNLDPPTYEKEGADLILFARSESMADNLVAKYRQVHQTGEGVLSLPRDFSLSSDANISIRLPSLALGTMKLAKRSTSVVVSAALKKGIDAIDTAPTYNNEEEIGAALAHQKLKPFIIVKVPKRATLPAQVRDEVLLSLQKLGREFVDLILLHWPCDAIEADSLSSVWKELEHLQAKKYCHFLGVCNFSIDALRTLIPLCSPNGRPVLNQIERHPLLPQWELLDFCARHGIQLQAHSPLGQGRSEVLEQHVVVDISKATGLSPAQVVLKWNLQHGIAVVTKSTSDAHLSQLERLKGASGLTPLQMKSLDSIVFLNDNASKRFVAPPFMFKKGAPYSWGDQVPDK